jgi:hypothetical protein
MWNQVVAVLSSHFAGGNKENHDKHQLGYTDLRVETLARDLQNAKQKSYPLPSDFISFSRF